MKAREVELRFERGHWRACGDSVDVAHRELRGLEALLEAQLAHEAPVNVRLAFDVAALPRWLQQYHGHYCNYTLHVPRRDARA
jgi:hypothetical protein